MPNFRFLLTGCSTQANRLPGQLGVTCGVNRCCSSVQKGFTIVELMIAMVLSLFLLGAITFVVVNSNKNYNTTDSLSRMQENARFAMDIITRDLRRAGHAGCHSTMTGIQNNLLNTTFGKTIVYPSYTDILVSALDGVENIGGGTGTWSESGQSYSSGTMALTSSSTQIPVSGSDAIAIRYVNYDDYIQTTSPIALAQDMDSRDADVVISASTGAANAIKAGDIVMISNCGIADIFQVKAVTPGAGTLALSHTAGALPSPQPGPGNSTGLLQQPYTVASGSSLVSITPVTYFVATNTTTGQRSLYQQTPSGGSQELVEGVESLQILYGTPDATTGVLIYRTADQLNADDTQPSWKYVASVRFGLLMSTMANTATGQYGAADTAASYSVAGETVALPTGVANERRLRRVFENTVMLRNML